MSDAAVPVAPPAPAAPPALAQKPPPATWKLVAVLGGGGAVAGLLLVIAYLATIGPITEHKRAVLADGVREVLGLSPADAYDELWWKDGRLFRDRPAGADEADRVWRGRRADGKVTGWAIVAQGSGFADAIRLIFGWDPARGRILALKVLENRETPGLGDKIGNDPSFAARFSDRAVSPKAALKGVKVDATPNAPGEVDTITGATVSSRAVIRIINAGVVRFGPAIEGWREEDPR